MKVGHQGVHDFETMARVDENPAVAGEGFQFSALRGRLQRAHRRGPHRDHATARLAGAADLIAEPSVHFQVFRVHFVILDVLRAHGLKGAGTHVQGDEAGIHPARPTPIDKGPAEMQARGGRRHGSVSPGVNSLVALPVQSFVLAVDVGRQRHMADAGQQRRQ